MKRKKDESGSAAVLVVLMLVSFFGAMALVSDVGLVYVQREKLINALDAGALAGISQIYNGAEATASTAVNYVQKNGENVDTVTVNPDAGTVDLYRKQTVPLYFARVLGFTTATFSAHTQATAGALQSGTGFVPLAVVQQSFVYGQTYQLSDGAGDGYDGNYGYLALGGNGASVFEQNLMYGYSGTLSVGEQVSTEPGVMAGPVADGINYRLAADPGSTFATANESSPRVILMPVIASLDVNGRGFITIVGFAAFYLDGLQGEGGHQVITGQFKQLVVPGPIGASTNFGLDGEKLTS